MIEIISQRATKGILGKKSPPLVVIIGEESVDKTNGPDYCSKQQHLSVETQPSKINTYLLPIILPGERKDNIFVGNSSVEILMLSNYQYRSSCTL